MGFGLLVTLGSVKLWWAFSHLFLHQFQNHFPSFALQIYILGVFCLSFLLWLISNYIKVNHLWCTYVTNTTYSWFSGKLNWCSSFKELSLHMNPQMSQQKYYLTYQFASVYLFWRIPFFFFVFALFILEPLKICLLLFTFGFHCMMN